MFHLSHNQKGFILPLTMILSFLLLAFVLHAILLLNSDRNFFSQSYTQFHLQQLRECALVDFHRHIEEKTLPENGTLEYEGGTVTFTTTEQDDSYQIQFTITDGQTKEKNKICYLKQSGQPIYWLDKLDP